MREIKFRAWDRENNQWYKPTHMAYAGQLESLEINVTSGRLGLVTLKGRYDESLFPDRFVIQQYTGLKDKNGGEIYEGDILLIPDTWHEVILDNGTGPWEDFMHLVTVVFQEGTFGVDVPRSGYYFKAGFNSFWYIDHDVYGEEVWGEIEVIGNIYEHPELLEGDE